MNYKEYLDLIAGEFLKKIEKYGEDWVWELEEIPTEDFQQYSNSPCEWRNYRYSSVKFRMAHVERYSDDKVHVLHVTTFPNKSDAAPIFGFDVIATEKKVLGCYVDFSPVLRTWGDNYNYSRDRYKRQINHLFRDFDRCFEERKEIPEWAEDIFGEKACFIEPKNDIAFAAFCLFSLAAYEHYLTLLSEDYRSYEGDIIRIQNRYCEVQARNPRTFNVLKAKIGEEKARYFMEEILFPKIKK